MAVFGGLISTNSGRNLLAKAQIGKVLNFKKVVLGDGQLGSSENIANITQLKNQVLVCDITGIKVTQNVNATITFNLSNQYLETGFYWRELGVIAEDPDTKEEVLYCYGNARENGEYISANGGADILEKNVSVDLIVTNVQNISATIDKSLVYASQNDIEETKKDLLNLINTKADKTDIDDMSKTYKGTSITANTVQGYGRINKICGKTIEEGIGEKSIDNQYIIRGIGDLINISNTNLENGGIDSGGYNYANTQRLRTKYIILDKGNYSISFSTIKQTRIGVHNYSLENNHIAVSGINGKYSFTITEKSKIRIVFAFEDNTNMIASDFSNISIQRTVEVISKNENEQSFNILTTKPLYCLKDSENNIVAQDCIDYKEGKVHKECELIRFDENDNWDMLTYEEADNRRYFFSNVDKVTSIAKKDSFPLSNFAQTPVSTDDLNDKTKDFISINSNGNLCLWTEKFNSVDELKTFLSSNNLVVICEKEVAIEEDINVSNKIIQYEGQTTIYNSDKAEIEVILTNNKTISELNEENGRIENKLNRLLAGDFIKGLTKRCKVANGGKVSAGDFVKFLNETHSIDTQISNIGYENYNVSAVALSENKAFVTYTYGSSYKTYAVVCKIENNSIKLGANTLILNKSSRYNVSAVALSENKIMIINGGDYIYGVICTINDMTINKGTETMLSNGSIDGRYGLSILKLNSNKVFIVYSSYSDTYPLCAIVCTINETTINKGTETTISSETYSQYKISAVALSEEKVFIVYSNNKIGQYLHAIVCTINETTINKGISAKISSENTFNTSMSTLIVDNNRAFIAFSGEDSNYLYTITITINDLDIKTEKNWKLSNEAYSGKCISIALLSNQKIFIAHNSSSSYYLNALIQDVTNFIDKVNSSLDKIEGVTTTSGTGGQIVNVVTPNYRL